MADTGEALRTRLAARGGTVDGHTSKRNRNGGGGAVRGTDGGVDAAVGSRARCAGNRNHGAVPRSAWGAGACRRPGGDRAAIGVGDLARPDYGDAVAVLPGEVPVFWACGVTSPARCSGPGCPSSAPMRQGRCW